jgi:hypothetical protein
LDSGRVTESGEGIDNIEEDSQILLLGVPFGDRRSVNHQGCIRPRPTPYSLLQLRIHTWMRIPIDIGAGCTWSIRMMGVYAVITWHGTSTREEKDPVMTINLHSIQ